MDDLKIFAESLEQVQRAIHVLDIFRDTLNFTLNITKTELTVFRHHSHRIPEVYIYYRNIKIKVVPKVKYLGLFFEDTADSSPGSEDREAPAERARYGFMAKLKKMGPLTVADKICMEFSMVGSVASFGSHCRRGQRGSCSL